MELICEKCGSENVYHSKKKNKYVCEDCGFEFDGKGSGNPLPLEECKCDDYWCKEMWEIAPIPLASSYRQLYNYVCENNIGCTLFAVRDVFELIIKIPITILFNCFHKFAESDANKLKAFLNANDEALRLYEYSMQMLVTGKWWECVRLGSRINDGVWNDLCDNANETKLYRDTVDFLKILTKKMYFQQTGKPKTNMVTWRNRVLGHGCLSDNIEGKIEDVPYILKMFKLVGVEIVKFYGKVCFANKDKNQLRGLKASKVDPEIFIMYHDEEMGEKKEALIYHAFLSGRISNLACFDGYEKGKGYYLGYDDASRYKDVSLSEFLLRHESLQLKPENVVSSADVFSETIETKDINALEEMLSKRNEIIGIKSLFEWLMDSVSRNSKGYFLLEAERGTGKSTFCSVIDQLNKDVSLSMDDAFFEKWNDFESAAVIRVWHFNTGYRERADIFISGIRDALLTMEPEIWDGTSRIQQANVLKGRIEELWNGLSSCKEKLRSSVFADCVNRTFKEYRERFGTKKMILVLDGIDEVADIKELFSFVPDNSLFADGVYIMFTCRTKAELEFKKDLLDCLSRLQFSEHLEVTVSSCGVSDDNGNIVVKEYMNALKGYVGNMMQELNFPERDLDIMEHIITVFDNRFSSIASYKALCGLNPIFIQALDGDLLKIFFDQIQKSAPNYYFEILKNILIVLASSKEELNIWELAYLSGEYCVSYRLLGALSDLRAFVMITRSSKGNLYSLSHAQWIEQIERSIPNGMKAFLMHCRDLLLENVSCYTDNKILQLFEKGNDGELWLIKNGFSIYLEYQDGMDCIDDLAGIFEGTQELLIRILENEKYLEIIANEFLNESNSDEFWFFKIKEQFSAIVKKNKKASDGFSLNFAFEEKTQKYRLMEDLINVYRSIDDRIALMLKKLEENKLEEDEEEYEAFNKKLKSKQAFLRYQLGLLYLIYDEIVDRDMQEYALKAYEDAQEANRSDVFGVLSARIHLEKAVIYLEQKRYYEACFECIATDQTKDKGHDSLSPLEKSILVQSCIIFSKARSKFDIIFPFTDKNESILFLKKGLSLVNELIETDNCELYNQWKNWIELLLEQ